MFCRGEGVRGVGRLRTRGRESNELVRAMFDAFPLFVSPIVVVCRGDGAAGGGARCPTAASSASPDEE